MQLLIDIQYFETNTLIDTDFDANKAYNHMVRAHEIQLYELYGKELYNRIQTALAGTPTADEQELIDLSKPFVCSATEVNYLPFLATPVTAKGVQERNGNFTQSSNDTNKGLMVENFRADMEIYAERVREYLRLNLDKFPEWKCKTGHGNFYTPIHGV